MNRLWKNHHNKFSWWVLISNLLVIVILAVAAIGGKVFRDVKDAASSVTQEVKIEQYRHEEVDTEAGQPINVLLMGVDGEEGSDWRGIFEGTRADTLMVVNLNPETQTTTMLSIPRDTYTMMKGREDPDKINHAFAYGGAELTINTVQDFLQIPIDYYAVVNMTGLIDLIDAVGGIEVTSPLTFEYRGTQFKEGETRHVNGVKAMNFARMRYDDPRGEVGRQDRQKIVIKALIDKIISLEGAINYQKLLDAVSDNMRTNADLNTVLNAYNSYLPALKNMRSARFGQLEEVYINDVFYFHIPLESRVKVSNELRQASNLRPISYSALVDPLPQEGNEEGVRSLTLVFNQYPTGVSQETKQAVLQSQQAVRSYRRATQQPAPVTAEETQGREGSAAPASSTTSDIYVPPAISRPVVSTESSSSMIPSSSESATSQPATPVVPSDSGAQTGTTPPPTPEVATPLPEVEAPVEEAPGANPEE